MFLDGCKRAETQSRQDRNYAYLLEVPDSSTFLYFSMGNERLTTTANAAGIPVISYPPILTFAPPVARTH